VAKRGAHLDLSAQRTRERFARFSAILSTSGLRSALADVLTETDYRFIALFRLSGGYANAAVFYDRMQPDVLLAQEVPATATYCAFTRDAKLPFVTADSLVDSRLDDHVARESVRAYCGIPILTPEGEFLGTLCHYDVVPRDPAQVDMALMCEIASALEQGGHVPPYRGSPAVPA
jgi:GAF domain-containing protein